MQISFNGWYAIPAKNGAFDDRTRKFMFDTLSSRDTSYDSYNNSKSYFMYVKDDDGDYFERSAKRAGIKDVRTTNEKEIFLSFAKLIGNDSKADKITLKLCREVTDGAEISLKRKGNLQEVLLHKKGQSPKIYGFDVFNGKLIVEQHKSGKFTVQNLFSNKTGKRTKSYIFEGQKILNATTYDSATGLKAKMISYQNGTKPEYHYSYDQKGKLVDKLEVPLAEAQQMQGKEELEVEVI